MITSKRVSGVVFFLLLFSATCVAQSLNNRDWFLFAHFKVLKIEKIPSKYMSMGKRTDVDNKACYLITVKLTDTNYYQQLADVYGFKESYKGTKFSIVSIDSCFTCENNRIRKGDTIPLTIYLWHRIWIVGDPMPRQSLWPIEIGGYRIPNKLLYGQPMKAKELKGLCYPDVPDIQSGSSQ